MTLDEAKAAIEALPGVHEVTEFIVRDDLAKPEYVRFTARCASPDLLPEETRRGIQEIRDALEKELDCYVIVTVSAGLRMPEWAAS